MKGKFKWFYSRILECAQTGAWVLLKNVNQANQAILARLYPLLECTIEGKKEIFITEFHETQN